ncbi:metallophosphoesterase [Sporolituus thermophilus]|uniref:Phosphoesterase n=1 Tax=Sporolituus thermophilus DSM 23256 TaxID=1123285 RepID=A0A1G7K559_9FIRM|nr:metallophosphoesterase [Sporolituus thermophilus]SDF32297.1 hypothetical protein SAMN05660235_01184 [Sporolituus thermophilus DSM 23256]
MRIGVISDTHGDAAAIRRAIFAGGPVDLWLHAGDYSQDANLLAELSGLKVIAAAGNCDGLTAAKIDEFVDAGGKKIWLTHGHRYQARVRFNELVWWGEKYEVDIVVFGHTHVPYLARHGRLIIFNPGSAARPRGGSRPSIGILTITADGQVEAEFIDIAGK